MTSEQVKKFEDASRPLIKFLNENCNPHAKVVVEPTGAELLTGECSYQTIEFIKD